MKPRLIIGLLIIGLLAISAAGQQDGGAQPADGMVPSTPGQHLSSTRSLPAQLQMPPESQNTRGYQNLMRAVLQGMTEDMGLIAQAAREGTISRTQAEYLSIERYYIGLMRLQLLRSLYQNASETNEGESYPRANTEQQVSSDTVIMTSPAPSPDISQQIASYL